MTRVLIVGAGPAGIRAAEALVAAGLRPVVVDEGQRAGGQIYRRPPPPLTRDPRKLYGSEAAKAVALHAAFDRLVAADRLDYRPMSSVVAVGDGAAQVIGPQGAESLPYDRLILATGAGDRMLPVPGWQAPGVYALGAAQIALKAQGIALGRRIALAGSGPLLTLVAHQLRAAGAGVVAVLDTAPLTAQMRGAVAMAAARPLVTLRGAGMRARLGRLYRAGVTLDRIEAGAEGPAALHWRDAAGRARVTACDTVALGWHLRAETALADLAGAGFDWSEIWAQWLPRRDALGRAGAGLYLAGDGADIAGADAAEVAGRLAAAACLQDMGIGQGPPARLIARAARLRRFAHGVAQAFPLPRAQLAALPGATVICRCEGATLDMLAEAARLGGAETNRVKSLARIGMGRCQGRYCQIAAAELIAARIGRGAGEAGRPRSQPPVRPAPIAAYLGNEGP